MNKIRRKQLQEKMEESTEEKEPIREAERGRA